MGILTEGAIVSEVRGSVGSRTFSKNAYGPYVKNKLVQTNPNTAKQRTYRNRVRNAVNAWRNLTEDERRMWKNWALENPRTNTLGKQVVLSGFNMFVSATLNRALVNASVLPLELVKDTIPVPTVGRLEDDGQGLLWRYEWLVTNPIWRYVYYLGQQRPVANNFVNPSELRRTGFGGISEVNSINIEVVNNNLGFPPFVQSEDLMSPMGMKLIHPRSGLASPMYIRRYQSIVDGFIH